MLGLLLEVEMSKKCMPLWRKADFEVKMYKTHHARTLGPLLEVEMSKKCMPLWREAHLQVKSVKNWRSRTRFGRSDVVSRGKRKGLCTLSKVSKTWGFCSISKNDCISKNDGRRGTFEEDLQRCIFHGRRSTRDMFIRHVTRSGADFLRGVAFGASDLQVCWDDLRDRCSTSYDLASLFRGSRSTLDRWSGNIAKRIGTRLSALHSTFHFWRKSRRIVSFLMLSTSKIDKISQNCVVLMLSSSKIEEFSQNCFGFDVAKFKNWGSLAYAAFSSLQVERQTDRQTNRQTDR